MSVRRQLLQVKPLSAQRLDLVAHVVELGDIGVASADTTPRTKTAAVQITRLSPTFPRHPCRHIQRIHPSTSSAAPTAFQGGSRRFIPHLGRGIRHRMTPVAPVSYTHLTLPT